MQDLYAYLKKCARDCGGRPGTLSALWLRDLDLSDSAWEVYSLDLKLNQCRIRIRCQINMVCMLSLYLKVSILFSILCRECLSGTLYLLCAYFGKTWGKHGDINPNAVAWLGVEAQALSAKISCKKLAPLCFAPFVWRILAPWGTCYVPQQFPTPDPSYDVVIHISPFLI